MDDGMREQLESLRRDCRAVGWGMKYHNRGGKIYVRIRHGGGVEIWKDVGDFVCRYFPEACGTSGATAPGSSITLRINP